MKDWQAAMDEIKQRGCWGIKHRNREGMVNPYRSHGVRVGGVRIGCSEIHKSELAQEIQLKRSSRPECEWNMKDWQAAMDQIETRGCWGVKLQNRKGMGNPKRVRSYSRSHSVSVCVGGVRRIGCSKIHKPELDKEIKLKRSSRAECEWTMKDWQAAMDEIKQRGCWGIKHRNREGMVNPNRSHSVRVCGVRIGCSGIHKSELVQEIQLKRSSRAACEWTMKDWQAAMDQIKNRGCWGTKYHLQGH
jgi:soluble cytochrome b562